MHLLLREKLSTTAELLPSLEPSPTILDSSISPKESELQPLDSHKLLETESLLPKDQPWLLINLPNSPQLEKVSFFWEAQEIDKQKDISVFAQVKRDPTLLLVLDQREESSKEQEAEDDCLFKLNKQI